jgi:hypothetical protein
VVLAEAAATLLIKATVVAIGLTLRREGDPNAAEPQGAAYSGSKRLESLAP